MLFFRPKVHFVDKKATKLKGGAIIISNHTSVLDMLLILLTFPFATIHTLAGETLYDCNPILKVLLKMLLAIRVDRKRHDLSFMSKTVKLLEKGENILIFPQSRLPEKNSSSILPFMPTFIYLAKESGRPIIPVWHSEKYGIHRTKVSVGTPIYIGKDECPSHEEIKEVTTKIQNELYSLADL